MTTVTVFWKHHADGIGNNTDTDDDGDSVLDTADAFPLISIAERTDTDGDGAPNDCDINCSAAGIADDDGDDVPDLDDFYPLVSLEELTDTDKDGMPNECDFDLLDYQCSFDSLESAIDEHWTRYPDR